eukprot:6459207-Amphidinium_carterae.1
MSYYASVSASIDDDTYFELVMRNAWHIAGGEGQAANTANARILVTMSDGSQCVVGIHNDLGLDLDDAVAVRAHLDAQGLHNAVGYEAQNISDPVPSQLTLKSDVSDFCSAGCQHCNERP